MQAAGTIIERRVNGVGYLNRLAALLARVRSSKDQSRLGAYAQASKQLKAILDRRTPYYAQADLVIDTTHESPEAIVDAIVHAFTQPSAARQKNPNSSYSKSRRF